MQFAFTEEQELLRREARDALMNGGWRPGGVGAHQAVGARGVGRVGGQPQNCTETHLHSDGQQYGLDATERAST